MKFFSVFRKTFREMVRDPLLLALSLVFAPAFVAAYWFFFPGGSTIYDVIVLNGDVPVMVGENIYSAGEGAIEAMENLTYEDGKPMLVVHLMEDKEEAERRLKNREAEALLIIPENFSAVLAGFLSGGEITTTLTFEGDLTNPYYPVAMVLSGSILDQYIRAASGLSTPVDYTEIALGGSSARSEFEVYIPGLMIFSVIMIIFLAAMFLTREVEAGTIRRLKLTRMSSFDLLGGMTAALVLLGTIQVLLTIATALAFGFRSQGSLWLAVAAGALTSLSVIGVGMIMASYARNVNQAFLLANFPLGIFMFFSGSIFPIPKMPLFTLFGYSFGLADILPPTHAVNLLNKVLTMGSRFQEVSFEITALVILSLAYFFLGVWLFQRKQLGIK